MQEITINPAYSAQPSVTNPNPMLIPMMAHIHNEKFPQLQKEKTSICDQGCGKLRHLGVFQNHYTSIHLVETKFQLLKEQRIFGKTTSITKYITSKYPKIILTDSEAFSSSKHELDIVFNICILDVVIPETRSDVISSAHNNLKSGGLFVVIIPRNISSILKRCNEDNQIYEGHYFKNHNTHTYYCNYTNTDKLVKEICEFGFSLILDNSKYRYISLIMQKE